MATTSYHGRPKANKYLINIAHNQSDNTIDKSCFLYIQSVASPHGFISFFSFDQLVFSTNKQKKKHIIINNDVSSSNQYGKHSNKNKEKSKKKKGKNCFFFVFFACELQGQKKWSIKRRSLIDRGP